MGKLILVTGGCRSGKSRYALERAKVEGEKVLYIATCQPADEEMRQRVWKHQQQRPAHWKTLENQWDLATALEEEEKKYDCFLIDCLTLWSSHLLIQDNPLAMIRERAEEVVSVIPAISSTVITVTNEVGWGIVPPTESGRQFRDIAGWVNQIFAEVAEEVILMVSGIPMVIKSNKKIYRRTE